MYTLWRRNPGTKCCFVSLEWHSAGEDISSNVDEYLKPIICFTTNVCMDSANAMMGRKNGFTATKCVTRLTLSSYIVRLTVNPSRQRFVMFWMTQQKSWILQGRLFFILWNEIHLKYVNCLCRRKLHGILLRVNELKNKLQLCLSDHTQICGGKLCNERRLIILRNQCDIRNNARKKNRAFPAPSFTKLTNDQQHCAQISYAEFNPSRTIRTMNVKGMDRNSFTPLRKVRISQRRFSRNSWLLSGITGRSRVPNFIQIGP
jgi:hypothetical protein